MRGECDWSRFCPTALICVTKMSDDMSPQQLFLQELVDKNKGDKLKVVQKCVKKITYDDITNAVLEKIDLNVLNIFVEKVVDDLLEKKFLDNRAVKCSRDILYTLILYYHPRLFAHIFSGHNPEMFSRHSSSMLKVVEDLLEKYRTGLTTDHYEKLLDVKHLLEQKPRTDVENITAYEYCYYLTWATFDRSFVDISKKQLMTTNTFDILAINARFNLRFEKDMLIMYKNIWDDNIPLLTEDTVSHTTRFENAQLDPSPPTTPLSIYDKDFNPIPALTTDKVCVIIDYGNGFCTKLFLGANEVTRNIASNIIDRRIIPCHNRKLLENIIATDIYDFLPEQCYEEKLDKNLLPMTKMKKVVLESFTPNIKVTITNILHNSTLKEVLPNSNDRQIFGVYLTYLYSLPSIDINTVAELCKSYLLEGSFV